MLEGEVKDSKGAKIGMFQIQFKVHNASKSNNSPTDLVSGEVIISSLLAHFNHIPGENGFLQVEIGSEKTITPLIQIVAGQMLWVEKIKIPIYDIPTSPENSSATSKIRISAVIEGEELAECNYNLNQVLWA